MNNLALESRITRLEKLLKNNKRVKNESIYKYADLVDACASLHDALTFLMDHFGDESLSDMMDLLIEFENKHGITEKDFGLL